MNKWTRAFVDGAVLLAAAYLTVSFWIDGNHDAAWGWGVAALWIFTAFCNSLSEAL